MAYWGYGLSPVSSLGDAVAQWLFRCLAPGLAFLIAVLSLTLMRLTGRYKVRVYVGSDPTITKVRGHHP
jgi:hypothetical protein